MKTTSVFSVLFLALALSSAPVAAASSSQGAELLNLYQAGDSYLDERAHLLADERFDDSILVQLTQHEDWRVALEAQVLRAWRASPGPCAQVWASQPGVTAGGSPRFIAADLQSAELSPVMLERYLHGDDSVEVRGAIIELLARSEGTWAPALAASLTEEPDPTLRVDLVAAMRRAEASVALPALAQGLEDPDAAVRAQAALIAGWHEAGAELAQPLMVALSDGDPDVRAMAARSLGWRGVDAAWQPLQELLQDPEADVRLRALRALEHVDARRAADLPQLAVLARDGDARVSRLAEKLIEAR